MARYFRGEFNQKVDSKGRMSIPAQFRRVLEEGDPDFPENPNPRLVMLYGDHLNGFLEVYTIEEMAKIEASISRMKRGSPERQAANRMIMGKSWETEVDRDGRIVLPKERREQIGLEGECTMIAMGENFEIWSKATYEKVVSEEIKGYLEDENFNPMSLLDD